MTTPHKLWYYIQEYQQMASTGIIPAKARIIEIGVQTGGSLELWKELWPHADVIVGIDNDEYATWPEGTIQLITDQANPALPELLAAAAGPESFHLIVDDASHIEGPTLATWRLLWPLVALDGVYVWEDFGAGYAWPEAFGSPAQQLAEMCCEVEQRRASLQMLPGMVILRKQDPLTRAQGEN